MSHPTYPKKMVLPILTRFLIPVAIKLTLIVVALILVYLAWCEWKKGDGTRDNKRLVGFLVGAYLIYSVAGWF